MTLLNEDNAELNAAADIVAAERNCDVFFYSGPIGNTSFGRIASKIAEHKQCNNALLILTTNGGSANAAYQTARLFQKTYKQFVLFAPSYCKSAGTIIALGAHRLIMDPFSELGPLDVQLFKTDEINTRKSGLLSRSSFESLAEASFELFEQFMLGIKRRSDDLISFRLASEVSAQIASTLMAPVYSQISPDVVGSDYRDLNVALQYGIRLARVSRNAPITSVMHLVQHYPSHDFIIDDEEAEDLFNYVDSPSENLYALMSVIGSPAYDESQSAVVYARSGPAAKSEGEVHDAKRSSDDGEEPQPLDESGTGNRPSDSAPEGGGNDGLTTDHEPSTDGTSSDSG